MQSTPRPRAQRARAQKTPDTKNPCVGSAAPAGEATRSVASRLPARSRAGRPAARNGLRPGTACGPEGPPSAPPLGAAPERRPTEPGAAAGPRDSDASSPRVTQAGRARRQWLAANGQALPVTRSAAFRRRGRTASPTSTVSKIASLSEDNEGLTRSQ